MYACVKNTTKNYAFHGTFFTAVDEKTAAKTKFFKLMNKK